MYNLGGGSALERLTKQQKQSSESLAALFMHGRITSWSFTRTRAHKPKKKKKNELLLALESFKKNKENQGAKQN